MMRTSSLFDRETQAHPWVVISNHDGRLDAADVLGVTAAAQRARLSVEVNASSRLTPTDPFRREWSDPAGDVLVRSEVWATSTDRHSGSRDRGTRLLVHTKMVQKLLNARASHLLLLLSSCDATKLGQELRTRSIGTRRRSRE